jgi:AcrR family transcriptional regulator
VGELPAGRSNRPGANPRTIRVRQIILDAAIDLLIKEGAGALTAVRIAEKTGVARTTIYRHWTDNTALLLDAIDKLISPHVPTSLSENLEEDLSATLTNLKMRMTKRPFRIVFAALLDHANRNRDAVGAQRRFVSGVLQPLQDVLANAKGRGVLPSTVDVETASAQLAGPLFIQHVMLRTAISDRLIAQTIERFLDQVGEIA